ncbi:MAG: hypothetical protein GX240_07450 [Candidatus Atribacteria bacterium]|nr:hypothetical protein [Candidatus Atribacteria bacterium]
MVWLNLFEIRFAPVDRSLLTLPLPEYDPPWPLIDLYHDKTLSMHADIRKYEKM